MFVHRVRARTQSLSCLQPQLFWFRVFLIFVVLDSVAICIFIVLWFLQEKFSRYIFPVRFFVCLLLLLSLLSLLFAGTDI